MSQFQLPTPGLWAVKAVQGAVAAGCFGVEFTMTRDAIQCRVLGSPIPSAHELFQQLLSGKAPSNRANHHWVVALRSLFAANAERWGWTSEIDGMREEVEFQNGEPVTREGSASQSELDTLTIRLPMVARLGNQFGVGVSEYKLLCDCCQLCPMPVTVDSRLISQQNPAYLTTANYAALWMEKRDTGTPGFTLNFSEHKSKKKKPTLIAAKVLANNPGNHECSLLICVSPAKRNQGSAHIRWMRDGALLDPIEILGTDSGVNVTIICPGDDAQMDLSEWALRNPQFSFPEPQILDTLQDISNTLRPRIKRNVSYDLESRLSWLRKFGSAGELVGTALCFILKSEDVVGIPGEFVHAIDSIAKQKELRLRGHGHY